MPHVAVKMWTGRSEEQKKLLADRLYQVMKETTGAPDAYITVSIEDFDPAEWPKAVYKPELIDKADTLYHKPGYGYSDEELGLK